MEATEAKFAELAAAVDELGQLKIEIHRLEARQTELRDQLAESGHDKVIGETYKAHVVRFERRQIDYRGLIERLKPSARMLARFTTTLAQVQVRVSPRKSWKEAAA